MKLLILGLVPLAIFWIAEEKFGTFWGLVSAMVWSVGECIYEYLRFRRVSYITLMSSALVVVLGGLGLLLDNSILFKFQPVILEIGFAGFLLWAGRKGEPLLFQMAKKTRPEAFMNQDPSVEAMQLRFMQKMTKHLLVVLVLHCVLLSYYAVHGTTRQWIFWKGVGFNVFVFIWIGVEFLFMKLKKPPDSRAPRKESSPPSEK